MVGAGGKPTSLRREWENIRRRELWLTLGREVITESSVAMKTFELLKKWG